MHHDRGSLVDEDEPICTITNPFKGDPTTVRAPFTGLVVGVLEDPVGEPANPLYHFVRVDDPVRSVIEAQQSGGGAAGRRRASRRRGGRGVMRSDEATVAVAAFASDTAGRRSACASIASLMIRLS